MNAYLCTLKFTLYVRDILTKKIIVNFNLNCNNNN